MMGSAERRASTDDLLARIDAVVTGHERQHSTERGLPVDALGHDPTEPAPFLAPAIEAVIEAHTWFRWQRCPDVNYEEER